MEPFVIFGLAVFWPVFAALFLRAYQRDSAQRVSQRAPRYRCLGCGGHFWGNRVCCAACNAKTVADAKERVPCGYGHSRRPDKPCMYCLATTGKVTIGETDEAPRVPA